MMYCLLFAKVGIKSCGAAREYVPFVHVAMYVRSYPTAISILEQTHAVYNAAWVVSDNYIASYLFPYFLCRSLLPFLNSIFKKNLVGLLFVVYCSIRTS